MKSFQVLELDNCSLLSSVSLDLPRLQNIRLVHCRKYVFNFILERRKPCFLSIFSFEYLYLMLTYNVLYL